MPRIDFYILPDHSVSARPLLACRLTEKAYGLGHKIYIHTTSAEQARYLDDLLWTFRQGSFVPHALCPAPSQDASPVLLGWQSPPGGVREVLINLSTQVPDFFEDFERVVELVDQDPETLKQSRARFRVYRERGCEPETIKL